MKKRVLIVDDSASVRRFLRSIFEEDGRFDIVGEAEDPYEAVKFIKTTPIDVMTLDVEMPRMNGLEFLKKIMSQRPIPVVMFSTLTQEGSLVSVEALKLGAIDVVSKPNFNDDADRKEKSIMICDKLYSAAIANINTLKTIQSIETSVPKVTQRASKGTSKSVILIGSSTGGPETLKKLLQLIRVDVPAIFITQHMPEGFVEKFAQSLEKTTKFKVRVAAGKDLAEDNCIYIAPGDKHLEVRKLGDRFFTNTFYAPTVSRHRPSVDVLFGSGKELAPNEAISIILTGMGEDGAKGMKAMHDAGITTIGQDESSAIVYGMPRAAYELGACTHQLSLFKIAEFINKKYR